jgi:hypothetical protein
MNGGAMNMTPGQRRSSRAQARGGLPPDRQYRGLQLTNLAATIMMLVQIALGFAVAQAVVVPSRDATSSVLTAVGRALSNGPVALTVHVVVGLILIIAALTVTARAVLVRQRLVLALSLIGLIAVVLANITGARFVGSSQDSASTAMEVLAVVALVCYLINLYILRPRRGQVG